MISEESIKKAKADQDKYWESLWKEFSFFKKTDIEYPDRLFANDSYLDGELYLKRYNRCMELGYVWMAKYWASAYLDSNINFWWNMVYQDCLREGLDSKKAIIAADAHKALKIKVLKEQCP